MGRLAWGLLGPHLVLAGPKGPLPRTLCYVPQTKGGYNFRALVLLLLCSVTWPIREWVFYLHVRVWKRSDVSGAKDPRPPSSFHGDRLSAFSFLQRAHHSSRGRQDSHC